MSSLERLEQGMPVVATDGRLGSIASTTRGDRDDATATEVIVLATSENTGPGAEEFRRLTPDMIDRVEDGVVYLKRRRSEIPVASEAVMASSRNVVKDQQTLRIPVLEEELDVEKRTVELGHITVQKKVEELTDEREMQLRYQQVEVERVPVDRVLDEIVEPYMDGDVFVVPVIEEEVIVTRQLRLKEEVRIRRSAGETTETIRTPYRREHVEVSEQWRDQGKP